MASEQFDNMVQMFKAQRAAAPVGPPDVVQLRQGYDMLGQLMPQVDGVEATDTDLAGVPAERLQSTDADDGRAILYLHGGGYCIGSRNSHRPLASTLAKASRMPVYVAEYRLAPESPHPAAVDDALAAYGSLRRRHGAGEIVVAGDSAGAGLALVLLILLNQRDEPLPAAGVLFSPWCDMTGLGEVSACAMENDYLRPETIDAFTEWYMPDVDRAQPVCSPIYGDLSGLPPMFITAGECEILCDMTRRMAASAKDAGVDVTVEISPELFHDWQTFAGALPEANESLDQTARFIRDRVG